MGIFLVVFCGFLGALFVFFITKHAKKWYHWLLAIGLYIWAALGVSFVFINSTGYHHKAVSVGVTFFGLTALVWALVLARMLGLINRKRGNS
ncbi:MAG: dehalogenase [Gracilibacteraceae bacterium]|nr:dehalogenase [Gracilibacteraceae bacterium]